MTALGHTQKPGARKRKSALPSVTGMVGRHRGSVEQDAASALARVHPRPRFTAGNFAMAFAFALMVTSP